MVVIGAGVGGLVAALDLAHQGFEVQVLEAAVQPGGKMRQVAIGDALLDAGPTVFTMRWVFESLFSDAGESLSQHLQLHQINTLARHAWSADERLDLFADMQQSADAIGQFAGAADAAGYLRFCQRARQIYQTLEQPFLRQPRPNPVSLAWRVGRKGLAGLGRISPFGSLWGALGSYFRDPRLQQLFGRYATYCGSSPFMAPATLMLVAHVEQDGVWLLGGGMHTLAAKLAELGAARGAIYRYDSKVTEIRTRHGKACGVVLANGEVVEADAVIFNGDVAALPAGLLGPAVVGAASASPPGTRSLSALTWNLRVPTGGFPLLRHNVFFSDDYAAEFNDLFVGRHLPQMPTVYVCAQDRGGPTGHDSGQPERLLCLVNAPATGFGAPPDPKALGAYRTVVLGGLARYGLQLDSSAEGTVQTTPSDFERLFPASGGALYGRASHGWAASFARPGARSRVERLYLAGGTTHPGPGVPMAALSGRLAAASVRADLGATLRRGTT